VLGVDEFQDWLVAVKPSDVGVLSIPLLRCGPSLAVLASYSLIGRLLAASLGPH
jgi:hypothetical protein